MTAYKPSPRPVFAGPAAIPYAAVTRYVWGDEASGEVADWIYASTAEIHALVFGLGPGGRFTHSPEFRTVFGADELLHVLQGTMVIANPETGEVHRVERGRSIAFGADTWHHVFAHGPDELRVIEFFAPPPSTGSSGAYARTRPYLDESQWRYADDAVLGSLPDASAPRPTLRPLGAGDVVWRRDLGVLCGLLSSTSRLTTGVLELNGGEASTAHAHGGAEVVYVLDGVLHVRAWYEDEAFTFELRPGDAAYLPAGARHEYRSYERAGCRAIFGVAPRYLL